MKQATKHNGGGGFAPPGARAAIYVRISDDRGGTRDGVTRQREDCEALVEQHGWQSLGVFEDNDISAYSGKPRPSYLQLCDDVEAGLVDVIVAWHPDRLHRSPIELESFIKLLESTGTTVMTVKAGIWDLSTPAGRMTARQLGAAARYESETKSDRATRKMQQLAEGGKFTGGIQMFGYNAAYEVQPAEAELIRDGAARVTAGQSLDSVAKRWNELGVRTRRGKQWTGTGVGSLLRNPKLAGLATYKGEILEDVADWEPIIDRATHEQIVSLLSRHRTGKTRRARVRLLPGFLWCGKCGKPLCGGWTERSDKRPVRLLYRCKIAAGRGGCGGISIDGAHSDETVKQMVLAALSGPGLKKALKVAVGDDVKQKKITADLARDREALARLTHDHYVEQVIGVQEFRPAHEALTARIRDAEAKLRPDSRAGVLIRLPSKPGELEEMWDRESLDWKRAVIGAVIDKIVVQPSRPGSNRFDRRRIIDGTVWLI